MRKFLYIMPAVLICMLYALLAALAGGFGGFQLVAIVNICLPILAGILLRNNKWWGCLFGAAMGALLFFTGMTAARIAGIALAVYYIAMGIVCAFSNKNQ
jgi:hypothetical protein